MQICFLSICILFSANFAMYDKNGESSELAQGLVLLMGCTAYPIYIIYYVNKRKGKLMTRWA